MILVANNNISKVGIDTQIYVYAYKKPGGSESEKLENHKICNQLLSDMLTKTRICVTNHQMAEIYHALAFRGSKMPRAQALDILTQIHQSNVYDKYQIQENLFLEACKLSKDSGIHVWDFFCFLPIASAIGVFYTTDAHFKNPVFDDFSVIIENPIEKWENL